VKTNKKILWILGIALAVIWGAVAFQIISALYSSDDGEVQLNSGLNGTGEKAEQYHYLENVRDPFRYFVPSVKKSPNKFAVQQPAVYVPPPFKLSGILVDQNKRTAVIEGHDGSVWFVQEKDTLGGLKILTIREKSVIYTYHKRKEVWSLPQ
jgi:hypothetical protein